MKKKILVVSIGVFHPSLLCRYQIKQLLLSLSDMYDFVFTNKLSDIVLLQKGYGQEHGQEGNFQGVILYYHRKALADDLLATLKDFISDGGGALAIHSAMASFKTNTEYQKLLGGKFTGHGKIEEIQVACQDNEFYEKYFIGQDELSARKHEFPKSVGRNNGNHYLSFRVRDELYIHEYNPTNNVVLSCEYQGTTEPVLWTKKHGRGKIAYFSLGHCSDTFKNRSVKQVITGALNYITGE